MLTFVTHCLAVDQLFFVRLGHEIDFCRDFDWYDHCRAMRYEHAPGGPLAGADMKREDPMRQSAIEPGITAALLAAARKLLLRTVGSRSAPRDGLDEPEETSPTKASALSKVIAKYAAIAGRYSPD